MPRTPDVDATPPTPRAIGATRVVAVASLLGLIVLGLAWELWLAPLRPGGSWWAVKVLPLALTLAGLLKRRMYTYRWLSLLVWLYITESLVRATTEHGLSVVLAVLQGVLALLLFGACAAHVRWRQKAAAALDAAPASP